MESAIKNLKDKSMSRLTVYKHLNLALECRMYKLDKDAVDTLFDIFNTDLLQGTQNGLNSLILNSIKLIFDTIKDDETYSTSLENITLTLFKHLIAIIRFPQGHSNQKICWEMISSLPDSILKNVMNSNTKQMSSFISQALNANIDHPVKTLISGILLRWLKKLSPEVLPVVTADCLNAWFGYTVPAMFIPDESVRNIAVESIELVLPHLKNVDYVNNPKWMAIMLDLQDKKKYTPVLLQTFHNKDVIWKNIWCIMLRLLEKDLKKNGLLINSLLPVLEQAFRDETTRKDAFLCWKILIDVSTSKTNEQNNPKIVKLLCTPLVSNNAKSVEIALAKFQVWWFLMTNLSHEIMTYQENLLYPFLNFCFGNDNGNEQIVPGLVFQSLRKFTICSLVEMFGHEESCKNCVGERVIHLRKPIVNNIMFDSGSKRWLDAVKSAIVVISEQMLRTNEKGNPVDDLKQNLRCIWTSLLKIVTKIVNPNLMTVTFRNILKMLHSLCENHQNNRYISESMIEFLIPSMVEKNLGYTAEFLCDPSNYQDMDTGILEYVDLSNNVTPVRVLFLILLTPKLQKCVWPENKVLPFKEMVCMELDNDLIDFCSWIIIHLTNSEPSLSIWCHLSDALSNSKYSNNNDVYEVVLCWPLACDLDPGEICKIMHSWSELYTFVANKVSTPKKSLGYFEESLISKIGKASDTTVESKIMLCTYFVSSIIKHRAKSNPVSQVTKQPPSLKLLHELLGQLKQCNITDHVIATVVEAVECVSCVLASYNSRRATPEYLQLLIKTAEMTLKTLNFCLQKSIFVTQPSECAKRLSTTLPSYLLSTFSSACCQAVSDIILALIKKNEEYMVEFKDLLQQVYKSQSFNAATGKKLDKLLKDKDIAGFKSPQQKNDGNGKVKSDVASSKDGEFVVIKPNWKFDPKKLTEHQKEILTRRRENIPALYEDLSQSQDDYNMKAWKPSGYTNDETSESSKDHDSSREKSRDISITKENVKAAKVVSVDEKKDEKSTEETKSDPKETSNVLVKKVLRDIPNPGLTDTTNNSSPQSGDVKSNKTTKVSSENVENDNIKLAIVASPKVVNKMTSFQSRLERSIKKLQEGSVKLDSDTSPTNKKIQEVTPNVTTPTTKKSIEDSGNVTPTAKSTVVSSADVNVTPTSKKPIENLSNVTPSSTKQNVNASNVASPVVTKVIHAFVNPAVTSPIGNPEECTLKLVATPPNQGNLKPPETERPMRHRKRPNKFDPDDLRFIGKRRASTSVLDIGRGSSMSDRDDSSETSSVNSDCTTNSSKADDDTTPTKIKKRKMRLLKNLEIDTVDGHPSKEIFEADKSSRRRSTVDSSDKGPEPKKRRISNKTGDDAVTTQPSKPKTVSVRPGPKSKTKLVHNEHMESSDSSQETNASRVETVPASVEIIPATTEVVVPESNDKIVISSQETPRVINADTVPVTQSETIILSDVPTTQVDESVIVIEPSLSTPVEVTEKLPPTPVDKPSTQSVIELSDDSDDEEINFVSPVSSSLPESQDVIQSSQDSTSNMSVTPRRIIAIINCKSKSSPNSSPKSKVDSKKNSVIIIPDTQVINNPMDTADVDTVPVASDGGLDVDVDVAEKSTEAVEPSISTTVEIAEADTVHLDDAETQMHEDDNISDEKCDATKSQESDLMDVDKIESVGEVEKTETEDNKMDVSVSSDGNNDKESEPENTSIVKLDTEDPVNDVLGTSDEVLLTDEENDTTMNRSTILSSPYNEDIEDRNAELLNNTLDISPIKSAEQEIDNEDKTSTDSNDLESLGCKVLSDNESSDTDQANSPLSSRNSSPVVMAEISPINSPQKSSEDKTVPPGNLSPSSKGIYSPSSSMNQKKSRPLMSRFGGRAAQMLGLCKRGPTDTSDNKFSNVTSLSPVRMIARKNLHSFYGNAASNNDTTECSTPKNEDENLLEFSKILPSPHASPSGPILKKDQSVSPTGKKKRVSFHDPPVSKQLNIEKYIDPPQIVRSPQRVKVTKSYKDEPASFMKQPKVVYCLVKKIDSVEPTISSSNDSDQTESNLEHMDSTNLSEICSLEVDTQQPIELVNNHLLDDTQPIYPTLVDSKIPISEIASDLTSNSCKDMFLNEIKDDITTIGDLANLTELKVNRLPISFPKVATVKKVLLDFESTLQRIEVEVESERIESELMESENAVKDIEMAVEESIVKDEDKTTQCMEVSNAADSEIEHIEQPCKSEPRCMENIHLIDGDRVDFNSDEDLIKQLDKILQRKTVLTYLSENIHKYFNIKIDLQPK